MLDFGQLFSWFGDGYSQRLKRLTSCLCLAKQTLGSFTFVLFLDLYVIVGVRGC